MLQERKVVQILQRHEAIKEKDLNPWDLVIKEIIDDLRKRSVSAETRQKWVDFLFKIYFMLSNWF